MLCSTFIAVDCANVDSLMNCDNTNIGAVGEEGDAQWVHVEVPPLVDAALDEEWDLLDPDGNDMISTFKGSKAFARFPHARDVFKNHLIGTFGLLGMWGQPKDVRRTGLFHTAYAGDLFGFAKWDPSLDAHREELRNITGWESEALTYLFGTVNRGALLDLAGLMANDTLNETLTVDSPDTNVENRVTGISALSAADIAKIMVVTMADYLEQMVEVNGWRDHHQVDKPLKLYPGEGRPALAFYWISKICNAVRNVLEVIPPVFDHCQSIIDRDTEMAARDAYWAVVLGEDTIPVEEQQRLLLLAASLNPFVGEPHFMLAQIAYRQGRFFEAQDHAQAALNAWYKLGTAWDKRLSFQTWVAHTQMILLRSNRRQYGLRSLPKSQQNPVSTGSPITMLDDVVEGFYSTEAPR